MHGTEVNNSNEHRLSFDFRILPHGENPGYKEESVFFTNNIKSSNKVISKQKCLLYLIQDNSLVKNFSHNSQRQLLQSFSKNHNLESDGHEETEIIGMSHHPNLFHYIVDEKVNNILMLSVMCLPEDEEIRLRALNLANKNRVILHFCLENTNNLDSSNDQVNKYYHGVKMAENNLKLKGN